MTNFGSILGDVLKNYSGVPQNPNDVANIPHSDVYNHYQQFVQQAPPKQVYESHQQAFQQVPQEQRQGLLGSLVGALTQNGVDPQQAGIQGNNASPQILAQAAQYISQRPDLLNNVFGNNGALNSPVAKMVMAGALAVAANRFMGGNKGNNKGGSMI